MEVRRGDQFTHLSLLDPDWTPDEGQRYTDAPKARCEVTRATETTVWYGYAGHEGGGFRLAREVFEERYGSMLNKVAAPDVRVGMMCERLVYRDDHPIFEWARATRVLPSAVIEGGVNIEWECDHPVGHGPHETFRVEPVGRLTSV